MSDDTDQLEQADAQRKDAKRATFAAFKAKKRTEREFTVSLDGEQHTVLFRALGATAYDKLLTAHPPTDAQRVEGGQYNIHTFAPALLARVCAEPNLDPAQWGELWNSEDWNRGEVLELFSAAVDLCSQGLSLVPTGAG